MSHRSFVHTRGQDPVVQSNERLEFLGDAVLDVVITHFLYLQYPHQREGDLSKMKSLIVSSRVLAVCAQKWDLGQHILLSRSEVKGGGRTRPSILADCFEAVLGAVYLEGGLPAVSRLIHTTVVDIMEDVLSDRELVNYKSDFLERAQSQGLGPPEYKVMKEWGPEHRKRFKVGVYFGKQNWGWGEGESKKSAEQKAARMAMKKFRGERAKNR